MMGKIDGGYILLARKIIESEIWQKPPLYLKVWIYLLTRAQHKPYKGLQKGQVSTSIPEICDGCKWKVGFRTVIPTKDSVFQALDWMRKTSSTKATAEATPKATMIAITKATQRIVVTIDKYCIYQDPKLYESNAESNNEGATKATTTPLNINKNDKNDKNDKNENIYSENPDLDRAVRDFIDHRAKIKKPITDKAIRLTLSSLQKIASSDPERIEILNQSIMNGWTGIFPLRGTSGGRVEQKKSFAMSKLAEMAREAAENEAD